MKVAIVVIINENSIKADRILEHPQQSYGGVSGLKSKLDYVQMDMIEWDVMQMDGCMWLYTTVWSIVYDLESDAIAKCNVDAA